MSLLSTPNLLESEIRAFLLDEAAFMGHNKDFTDWLQQTGWALLEQRLTLAAHGCSLEQLQALRDRLWYQQSGLRAGHRTTQTVDIYQILHHTAHELLHNQGGTAQPHNTGTEDILAKWRWYVYALPPDLMLAAGWDIHGPRSLETHTPLMRRQLEDKGYAQMHVHLGAELDFPLYWAGAMAFLGDAQLTAGSLSSPGAGMQEGQAMAPWLVAAGIMRLLLYTYLIGEHTGSVKNFLAQVQLTVQQSHLGHGLMLRDVVHGLLHPQGASLDFRGLQALYRHLYQGPKKAKDLASAWELDPLAGLPPKLIDPAHKEVYWLRTAFAYLKQHPDDRLFTALFWQTVRMKVILYRHIVQRPMVKGLQWFTRHYERIGALVQPLKGKKTRISSALKLDGQGKGLKALEVRIAPDNDSGDFRASVFDITQAIQSIQKSNEAHKGPDLPEIGLVVHFSKQRAQSKHHQVSRQTHHWQTTHADPSKNNSHYRYSHFFNQKTQEALAYKQLLEQVPLSILLIRGIDMCTDEIGIPNWVMALIIQSAYDAGLEASRALHIQYPDQHIPPPQQTMHVGEDFHHLMDGIRRMAEVIDYFPLHTGDRIGHGLALGLSPRRWAQQHPVTWMPREIRIWDLVWELLQYRAQAESPFGGRIEWIHQQLQSLSEPMFGAGVTVDDLCRLYQGLFQRAQLWEVGFPNEAPTPTIFIHTDIPEAERQRRVHLQRLYHYLTSSSVFAAGAEIIEVHQTEQEIRALYAMQRWVRDKVRAKDITIEVNPSSNFLIADLHDLKHHSLWNLNPPDANVEEDLGPAINICIGSDDPITFATNLPQEYELLYNVLTQRGTSREDARDWLRRLQETGLRSRFTLPVSTQQWGLKRLAQALKNSPSSDL
jgi:hypothetical protein